MPDEAQRRTEWNNMESRTCTAFHPSKPPNKTGDRQQGMTDSRLFVGSKLWDGHGQREKRSYTHYLPLRESERESVEWHGNGLCRFTHIDYFITYISPRVPHKTTAEQILFGSFSACGFATSVSGTSRIAKNSYIVYMCIFLSFLFLFMFHSGFFFLLLLLFAQSSTGSCPHESYHSRRFVFLFPSPHPKDVDICYIGAWRIGVTL